MSFQTIGCELGRKVSLNPGLAVPMADRSWYAVYTVPQHEKSVLKHLNLREVESFLPTYKTARVWKNRQRMSLVLPLFPTYLFVHINYRDRTKVLKSPGVLRIVGNARGYIPLSESEIEFLRSGCHREQIEPYRDLVVGEKVRIKSGMMEGVQGTLVRKNSSMKFVLTLELINQHAAIQVDAEDLEPVLT